jgi:hypothetical protein
MYTMDMVMNMADIDAMTAGTSEGLDMSADPDVWAWKGVRDMVRGGSWKLGYGNSCREGYGDGGHGGLQVGAILFRFLGLAF